MEILADILLNSTFPANEVERERRVILEEIRSAEDNPEDCAYELLVQGLWGGSPLGRPIGVKERRQGARARLEFFFANYRLGNCLRAGGVTHEHPSGSGAATSPSSGHAGARGAAAGRFYSRPRDLSRFTSITPAPARAGHVDRMPVRPQHDHRRA
jgi:hypothetical protein